MNPIMQINESEIIAIVQSAVLDHDIVKELAQSKGMKLDTLESIGNTLPVVEHGTTEFFMWPEYWASLKCEMRKLICDCDATYKQTRSEIDKMSGKVTTTVLGIISAAVASKLGLGAG